MDLVLALDLIHAVSAIVWLFGGAVLALILVVAGRDRDAALRAVSEARLIGRRVLSPAALATVGTGLVLAVPTGHLLEAWVILGAALAFATVLARPRVLEPALDRAATRPEQAPRALGLALLDLLVQVAVLALMVLRPGWTETLILAGLFACIALAVALWRHLGEATALPS